MNHGSDSERSFDRIRDFGPALAAEAAKVLSVHPDAELVGVVLERGAGEYKRWRTAIEQGTGIEIADPAIAGVVPRSMVIGILRSQAPQGIAWIVERFPPGSHQMPILYCGRDGFRFGGVDLSEGQVGE